MRLWILEAIRGDRHWQPWYDKAFGFVVRAETEDEARAIADREAGEENRAGSQPWLSPKHSTCEPLDNDGPAGMILRDFNAA